MREPPTDRVPTLTGTDRETVAGVMHRGVISVPSDTPLRGVARAMCDQHVHSVVVLADEADGLPEHVWGVISSLDLVAAVGSGDVDRRTAADAIAAPVVTVGPEESLTHAAQLMAEHGITHLVVVEAESGRPAGVLSTLDVARALAEGRT